MPDEILAANAPDCASDPSRGTASPSVEFLGVGPSYDSLAATYDDAYAAPEFLREDAIVSALLRKEVGARDRVLDVGCGTGKALELLSSGVDYVGLDLSPEMLAVATGRFPARRFLLGSAESLPFPDSSFDVVVSTYGALSHVERLDLALAEISRVLVPGGTLVAMFYGLDRAHSRARRRTELVKYVPRSVPGGVGIPAWLYSWADARELVASHMTVRSVRGLTVLGACAVGGPLIVRRLLDVLDRALSLICKDYSHSIVLFASKTDVVQSEETK